MSDKMIALEIIEYFRAEEMVNNNTPFEEQDYVDAIKELEDLEILSCSGCVYEFKSNYAGCNVCSRNFPDRYLRRD